MSRPRRRVCLQEGLHLDLNQLARAGFIRRGTRTNPRSIQWTHPHWGKIASGLVSADMSGPHEGWLDVQIEPFAQRIALIGRPRHFGGRQWYLVCPATGLPVSVVWKPEGADKFCCRQTWGSQVAYLSQFGSWVDRAHLGKARIKAKLLGDSDPAVLDLPPKPKGMRRGTYLRLVDRYNAYDGKLNDGIAALAPRSWREGQATDFD
jgi:hypothetical protein